MIGKEGALADRERRGHLVSPDLSVVGLHVDGADHLLGHLGGVPRVHQHGTPDGPTRSKGRCGGGAIYISKHAPKKKKKE